MLVVPGLDGGGKKTDVLMDESGALLARDALTSPLVLGES
jgi:hypothetical protein